MPRIPIAAALIDGNQSHPIHNRTRSQRPSHNVAQRHHAARRGCLLGAALLAAMLAPAPAAAQEQPALDQPALAAALLPSSRSLQVGQPAAVFATLVNGGPASATGCGVAPLTSLPISLSFQATDPATNQITGLADQPQDIAVGAAQSFLIRLTATAAFAPSELQLEFDCANSDPAPVLPGVNTLSLSASTQPVADIIALAATLDRDGIVTVPHSTEVGLFAVASVNLGAAAPITARAQLSDPALPLALSICQTDPNDGSCLAPPAPQVGLSFDPGATQTFAIFATGNGEDFAFDPARRRILVEFRDDGGALRGGTSVALRSLDLLPSEAKRQLGQLLFFDKLLSGNRNISCATCHHPLTNSGDDLSLPIGEGGSGLGPARDTGGGDDAVVERVPRNAPHLFNLGDASFTALFFDGRVALDPGQPSGFLSPAGNDLPSGLDNPLAVQAMFPVTSGTEMAGQAGENEVADAAAANDLPGVWAILAERLRQNPEYVSRFMNAFPNQVLSAADISFVLAANAIGFFEAESFQARNSPFDRKEAGEATAMSAAALRGEALFNGKGQCSQCHSGPLQTDQSFRSIALPQIGPGKGDGVSGHEDFGRERVTGDPADRYRFRTPSLRNVELTAPYGHDGAYASLAAIIRHHNDPVAALESYDIGQAVLPSRPDLDAIDGFVQADAGLRGQIAAANELAPLGLSEAEIGDLVEFMKALTDPASRDLSALVPESLPSGLPVAD